MPKYMRIQGREIAFKTGNPAGLFALCWRRIRDGIFSAEDEAAFRAEDKWFRENLPIPPFSKMTLGVKLHQLPGSKLTKFYANGKTSKLL